MDSNIPRYGIGDIVFYQGGPPNMHYHALITGVDDRHYHYYQLDKRDLFVDTYEVREFLEANSYRVA